MNNVPIGNVEKSLSSVPSACVVAIATNGMPAEPTGADMAVPDTPPVTTTPDKAV